MMIHSGEKPWKCDICDRSFRRSDALQCHQKTHRKEIDKKQTDAIAIEPPANDMTHTDLQYNQDQNLTVVGDIDRNDIANIESIPVVHPHQTSIGDQTFNTFNYNFIL